MYAARLVGIALNMGVVRFFFQAEDGIRDLVRSRGLGDVYKRQTQTSQRIAPRAVARAQRIRQLLRFAKVILRRIHAVSYTHLTLPTSDLV